MTTKTLQTQPIKIRFRLLQLASMLYISVMLVTIVLTYKITTIFGYTISTATFLIPLWYSLGDIITEVYGYSISRRLIWYGLLCQAVFHRRMLYTHTHYNFKYSYSTFLFIGF